MSIKNSIESKVSPESWVKMAETAGVSVDELKDKIINAIEGIGQNVRSVATTADHPTVGALTKSSNDCDSQKFSISLFEIIGLSGELTLCGTSSSDWTASLKVCLVVAGAEVWCTTYKFDPHNLGVCFSPSVGVAKADICFNLNISDDKVCLNINGKACYWAFGWSCGKFDTTVFCIPLP